MSYEIDTFKASYSVKVRKAKCMLALQSEANVCRHKCSLKKSRLLISMMSEVKANFNAGTANVINLGMFKVTSDY